MGKEPVKASPALAELRKEIDRIDEAMHQLLMERGEIIDRLIATKGTQESGSAFRPAREADMMRRLVQRHHGILPLDTAESIWRVIIATFTHVQAPFGVHADLSSGDALMRDSARFHFGFTVPYVAHFSASAAVDAVARSKGDLALVGPRPEQGPFVDRFSETIPFYTHRHLVRPGLTGWAQVNGRDELPIFQKVALDAEYLQRQGFWLDIQILWLTFLKVVQRDGVSH